MDTSKLLEPIDYTIKSGGKNIRELCMKYVGSLFGNLEKSLTEENKILVELAIKDINEFHNVSLVIDDIQDDSKLRRGKKCSHLVYGIPLSINSGYLKCFQILNSIEKKYPEKISDNLRKICIKLLENAHIGQGFDIYWTKIKYIPKLEEYIFMIDNKTSHSFVGSVDLCFEIYKNSIDEKDNEKIELLREKKEKIKEILVLLGRFFQIRDDYINLTSVEYWSLKGFCEDFDERKVSYIFTILKDHYNDHKLYNELYKKKVLTNDDKLTFYTQIYDKKVFNIVYNELNKYKEKIINIDCKYTKKKEESDFLKFFFNKLNYDIALSPDDVKKILLKINE